jgi:hypothetical protein
LRRRLPAIGDEHEGREKFGHRRADIAGAENAKREALLFGRIPARHIGDTDGKRTAGDADPERREQHLRIGLRVRQREGCRRRGQHRHRVDQAAAVLIGPDTERQTDQRAGENRRADEKTELGFVESELILDADADDRKYRPDREADRESDCRSPKRPPLFLRRSACLVCHGRPHPGFGCDVETRCAAERQSTC